MLESLDIFHNAKILNEWWNKSWKIMSLIRTRNLNLGLNVMMSEWTCVESVFISTWENLVEHIILKTQEVKMWMGGWINANNALV